MTTQMPQDVRPPRQETREHDHLFRSKFFKVTALLIGGLFLLWMIIFAVDIAGGHLVR